MQQQNNTVLKIYLSVCCDFVLARFSLLFLCLVTFVNFLFDCVLLFMCYFLVCSCLCAVWLCAPVYVLFVCVLLFMCYLICAPVYVLFDCVRPFMYYLIVCPCLCAISVTLFFSHVYVVIIIRNCCDLSSWFVVVLSSALQGSVRVVWILRQALNISRCVSDHRVLVNYPLRVIAEINSVVK
jgi:hypothetical protein